MKKFAEIANFFLIFKNFSIWSRNKYSESEDQIMKRILTEKECDQIITGEITLAAVMAICAIAIVAVVVYRMFMSKEGSSSIPGGWKFSWK